MKKFLLNYPQNERISTFLLDFFWNELNVARSTKNYELWLISPWITDSYLDLSSKGTFSDLWPGFTKSSLSLKQILKKFLEYDSKIKLVCLPPHSLVSPKNLSDFYEFKVILNEMDNLFKELDEQLEKMVCISSSQKILRERIVKRVSELKQRMSGLRNYLNRFRQNSKGYSDVLTFIYDLINFKPKNVDVYFNYRLHAKIILGKYGGFIGSANITNRGLNFNDEIFLYITDEELLEELRKICSYLARSENEWWKKRVDEYPAEYEYVRQIGRDKLMKIINDEDVPKDIKEIFEIIGILR